VVTAVNPDGEGLNLSVPQLFMQVYPNPVREIIQIKYRVATPMKVTLKLYDMAGKVVATPLNNEFKTVGIYSLNYPVSALSGAIYLATLANGSTVVQSARISITK
jgi:hypothetical protein